MREIVGVILAGGRSSRMNGINKSLLKIGNKTMIEVIFQELEKIFNEIIISGENKDNILKDVIWIPDSYTYVGPIGGIYTVLEYLRDKSIFAVGCDMPFISSECISKMVKYYTNDESHIDILYAEYNNFIHPLHSIYSYRIKDKLKKVIEEKEYSLLKVIKSVESKGFPIEDQYSQSIININTPEDYSFYIKSPINK